MKGKPQDIFVQAFKALADKKVTAPGTFRSHDKRNAIKCSVKANEGLLYPLERSLFFIPKPPIHVHFDEIACEFISTPRVCRLLFTLLQRFVEFGRMQQNAPGTTRNFDMNIALKGGSSHQFTNIMRYSDATVRMRLTPRLLQARVLQRVQLPQVEGHQDQGPEQCAHWRCAGLGRRGQRQRCSQGRPGSGTDLLSPSRNSCTQTLDADSPLQMREGGDDDSEEDDDDFVAKEEEDVAEEYESGPESVGSPSASDDDSVRVAK